MFESMKKMMFRHNLEEFVLQYKKEFCKKYQIFNLPNEIMVKNSEDGSMRTILTDKDGNPKVSMEDLKPLTVDEFYETIKLPGSDGIVMSKDGKPLQRIEMLADNDALSMAYLAGYYNLIILYKDAMNNIFDALNDAAYKESATANND